MSLQWTIVATFLYSEMVFCILLMVPFISATTWRKLFRSRLFNALASYAHIYFYIFIAVLVILFLDGVRDVWRYSVPLSADDLRINPNAESVLHMKLFRSQRNFYIAGFALFLCLVLRRLVVLINKQAQLEAELYAAQRQATNATLAAEARQVIEHNENTANEEGEENQTKKELMQAQEQITILTEEVNHHKADVMAIKLQAESTNAAYDSLLKEHETLQNKVKELEGSGSESSKKEE